MEEAREFLYAEIRKYRHDVGHAINWKGICMDAATQPPHVANGCKKVADEMIAEGLIEKKESGEFLTQKGYNAAWGRN